MGNANQEEKMGLMHGKNGQAAVCLVNNNVAHVLQIMKI